MTADFHFFLPQYKKKGDRFASIAITWLYGFTGVLFEGKSEGNVSWISHFKRWNCVCRPTAFSLYRALECRIIIFSRNHNSPFHSDRLLQRRQRDFQERSTHQCATNCRVGRRGRASSENRVPTTATAVHEFRIVIRPTDENPGRSNSVAERAKIRPRSLKKHHCFGWSRRFSELPNQEPGQLDGKNAGGLYCSVYVYIRVSKRVASLIISRQLHSFPLMSSSSFFFCFCLYRFLSVNARQDEQYHEHCHDNTLEAKQAAVSIVQYVIACYWAYKPVRPCAGCINAYLRSLYVMGYFILRSPIFSFLGYIGHKLQESSILLLFSLFFPFDL